MTTHRIDRRTSKVAEIATCACGWSHVEKRSQNAWARKGKMNAAIKRHLKENTK